MSDFRTLISAPELASRIALGVPDDWIVFDCRHDLADAYFGERVYALGHIPGAQFLRLDRDLSGSMNGKNGRHPLPEAADFCRRLGRCGVDERSQVVAYDDAGGMFAARLWWMLRWVGHERVAVLDGGLQAWCRAGQALSSEVPEPTFRNFSGRARPIAVDANHVLSNLGAGRDLVVDARSPDRFRGENETLDPVGGIFPAL